MSYPQLEVVQKATYAYRQSTQPGLEVYRQSIISPPSIRSSTSSGVSTEKVLVLPERYSQNPLPPIPPPTPTPQPSEPLPSLPAPPPLYTQSDEYSGPSDSSDPPRRILGLSVGAFWVATLTIAIVLSACIGGGIWAGIASQNSCSAMSSNNTAALGQSSLGNFVTKTVTVTASSTASGTPTSTVLPAPSSPCQTSLSANGSSITPLDATGRPVVVSGLNQTFEVLCNTNYPGGVGFGNPQTHDIMVLYTPDLQSCMLACAEYNSGYVKNQNAGVDVGGGTCVSVALLLQKGVMPCFLKNGTGTNDTTTSGNVRIDSAVLLPL